MLAMAGVSHHTAPLSALEALGCPRPASVAVVAQAQSRPGVHEAAVLSTCNRTEIYLAGPGPLDPLNALLELRDGGPLWQLAPLVVARSGPETTRHLFRVAAGLESRLIGESEILGQVRATAEASRKAGCLGPELEPLFRWAVSSGRRVRRETELGAIPRSLARTAVDLATTITGSLQGRRVLVVGAGYMAAAAVACLVEHHAHIFVCARDPDRVRKDLATHAQIRSLDMVETVLAGVELAVCATSAPEPILTRCGLSRVMAGRSGRRLTVVDLALPRNADPGIGRLPNVELIDLDVLDAHSEPKTPRLADAVARTEAIVSDQHRRYLHWTTARWVAATMAALSTRLSELSPR